MKMSTLKLCVFMEMKLTNNFEQREEKRYILLNRYSVSIIEDTFRTAPFIKNNTIHDLGGYILGWPESLFIFP